MIVQQDGTTFRGDRDNSIITLGGVDAPFYAQMHAVKNGEPFAFTHQDAGAPTFENGILESVAGTRKHRFYDVGDRLQYDIEYTGPLPDEEVFDVSYGAGTKLLRQPPLTEEPPENLHPDAVIITENEARSSEGILLNSRPDDIVGSFAVYCDKKGNEYQTGKLLHIRAFYLIDSLDQKFKVSATENKITGQLIVDYLPAKDWEATIAVGNIRLDPDFGYTTAGASTNAVADDYMFEVDDANFTGDVDSISAYCYKATAGTCRLIGLIYDQVSVTDPDNLLTNGATPQTSFTNTSGAWVTATYSSKPAVTNGTGYHVCAYFEDLDPFIHYDTGDAVSESTSRRTGGWPTYLDPFTAGTSAGTLLVSIYASGAAAGTGNPWNYYAQQ